MSSSISVKENFPVTVNLKFSCSKETMQKTLVEMVSLVSLIYAKFPNLNEKIKDRFRAEGVLFPETKDQPSESECQLFGKALKNRILTDLSQEQDDSHLVNLSTDCGPEKTLLQVAESVFGNKYPLFSLFPSKTLTTIYLNRNRGTLLLNLNLSRNGV